MPTTKKKVSILTIILSLVTLLASGAAVYFWYQKQPTNTIAVPEAPPISAPVFITLKPFTTSLPIDEDSVDLNKVLYIGMVLRIADEDQKTVLLEYLPEVRSDVLLLVSKQNVNKLKTESGKLELQEQVKATLSRQYDSQHLVKIDEVLFTDFIIR